MTALTEGMARHANIIAEKLRALEDNIVIGSRECLGAGSCLLTLRSFGGVWGLWWGASGWKVGAVCLLSAHLGELGGSGGGVGAGR